MTMISLRAPAAIMLGFCAMLGVSSCRRLNVRAKLEDIEWVIVACHSEGFCKQWVSKLTPETDAELIEQLIAAINAAKWKGESDTGGDGFIVFKLKRGGVQAFNLVPWAGQRDVEIRPGFWSRSLAEPVNRIGEQKAGWRKGDSIPDLRVKEIQVRRYGKLVGALGPDSPSFTRLLEPVSQILRAFDPRWCMPNWEQGNPVHASRYQQLPQFILLLENPIPMYKLVVWWKQGAGVLSRVSYKTFSSSLIAIYAQRVGNLTGGPYVAFVPNEQRGTSYNWNLAQGSEAARTMGKPDAYKAFTQLLEEYEKIAPSPR